MQVVSGRKISPDNMAALRVSALTLPRKAIGFARVQLCFRACQRTCYRPTASTGRANHSTTSTAIENSKRIATIDRADSKLFNNADEAVADLKSGSTILSSGFGLCGVADTLISAIRRRGPENINSLTAVSNNAGAPGKGGLSTLTQSGQVNRLIISYLGNNKALERKYLTGQVSIELCPQGTLAERLRAGGAGIPAFYTATGAHTFLQDGKIAVRLDPSGKVLEHGKARETRIFNNKKYLMETALTGDVAILRAWKADEAGNCVFRYAGLLLWVDGDANNSGQLHNESVRSYNGQSRRTYHR
ncbi:hypothetical protein BJX61DRAFT_282372 [Aspergillus egyptiacus]|nr:hypothetical protein BJX61DRAFT_282372 [Aspergillus egyptiacus]